MKEREPEEEEEEEEEEGTYEHGLEDEQNDEHVVASCWQRMLPNLLPSLSILQPPVSVAVFLLLLLASFPGLDFLSGTYCCCCCCCLSLSLSLSKNQSGGERKKKICITTHIKALAPMKNKDSSSSSSPWVLSAELQNLSANQTWYNNICSNHGM